MKSKTKTLPTDAVLRDMLKQAGLDLSLIHISEPTSH